MECSVTMMFTLPPEYPLNEYAVPEIVAVEGSESVQRKLRTMGGSTLILEMLRGELLYS